MRLAVGYAPDTANSYYRALLPLLELQRRGHDVQMRMDRSLPEAQRGTPSWDLIHLHKFVSTLDLATVQRLRARGVGVTWDTDDDIFEPEHISLYTGWGAKRKSREYVRIALEIARSVHLVTTPSRTLAEKYRDAGVEHVQVIENHLAPQDVQRPRRRHAGLVIGCTAAAEHEHDLRRLRISATLERIMRTHDHVRVISIGVPLELTGPRYVNHRRIPIQQLVSVETEFDIGIAPLVDSAFNRGRSNVKLKEYAAAGAAWLASPTGPYVGMGEAQGGLLVDDEEWFEAIDRLVRDGDLRRRLARRATAWARRQTIEHAGRTWEASFRDALVRARRSTG